MDLDFTHPENLPDENPILSILMAALIAILVYLGIQVALGKPIDPAETVGFAVVFTGVYGGFLYLLTRSER